jgi:peptidoglycan-associated lipoprotein
MTSSPKRSFIMSSKLLLTLAAAVVVTGCASNATDAKTGADRGAKITKTTARGDTSLLLDSEIASKCALPDAHFAFDSAHMGTGEAPALDALAACFKSGPLKGRGMMLVGHADPRGELHYNFALGQQRAGSVADYLGRKGLAEDRVSTSSLGELEANGTDDVSWALDRKVEVLLADE